MRFVDLTLIVLVVSGIAYLAMLFALMRSRGIREGSPLLLAAFLLSSLGWVVLQSLYRLQELKLIAGFDLYALARLQLYPLLVNAVLFLQLTRRFQRSPGRGLAVWISGAVLLLAVILLYENPLRLPDTFFARNGYVMVRWLLAFTMLAASWGLFMAGAVILTIQNYHLITAPLHRNRGKYWSLAAMLAVLATGLALLRLPVPGNLLHVLAVGATVYGLLTYNRPDLRLASRRVSSYVIMTLVTVAVYTGIFSLLTRIFQSTPGFSSLLLGVILAVALTILFNPLLGIVQRFVSRLISGVRYDSRQTLGEYSMSISNILDIDLLATVAVGLISEALEISHGALVIVHFEPDANGELIEENGASGVYHLRSISGLGEEMPEGSLNARNPFVHHLQREHRPLAQYDIDLLPRFHAMEPGERAWLTGLNMDVYVPIYTKDNWIGMLALGPKISGDRYFNEDLDFLQTLADQTAVALENARLYDDLKQRNSENEHLNADLKAANEELARLDRAKTDFINIASHELRTPLTQVIGYNDILGEMIKANQMQMSVGVQMTESVRKAARRLEEIVETMFDVSKLDTHTLDLMRVPVSLSSVISIAVDTWTKGMDERKQTVSVRGLANLPTIMADSKRLTQVFSHLVQNAIKSTPDGGQIRISGRVMDDISGGLNGTPVSIGGNGSGTNGSSANGNGNGAAGGGNGSAAGGENGSAAGGENGDGQPGRDNRFVEIIVADTGIGIANEDLERIFEKFFRVGNVLLHSTGETKFKGAGPGLGLTIARGIIEAHGGRIWAESPGHDEETCPGAKFHVVLPVRAVMPEMIRLTRAGVKE